MKKTIGTACIAGALASASFLLPTAAQSAPLTAVHDCGGSPQVKPSEIIFYCGDAGDLVHDITWSQWDAGTAVGNGTEAIKQCKPNCAQGVSSETPVKIQLDTPTNGVFKRALVTGPSGTKPWTLQ
ncbi:MAG: hypothetical protein J2P18_18125 [Nocardia sp.]|nr:hypothetical protein [Nocardia sp.]